MKYIKRYIILISIALLGLTSCIKEVEFTGEETAPLPVLNCLVGDGDTVVYADLTKSLFFLRRGDFAPIIDAEVVLTCIFVYAILNVTDEKAGTGKIAGIVIGLTLTLVHLIGINLTGTSVNPARSLATALSAAIYNHTSDAIAQVWMFIVAPMAGAALAACLYKVLNTEKVEAKAE